MQLISDYVLSGLCKIPLIGKRGYIFSLCLECSPQMRASCIDQRPRLNTLVKMCYQIILSLMITIALLSNLDFIETGKLLQVTMFICSWTSEKPVSGSYIPSNYFHFDSPCTSCLCIYFLTW